MSSVAVQSPLSRIGAAWSRFWFTPSDPTVLGAIRIVTGLVTFYTLLAYSFDLQALMGPEGWTDLKLRQEQYRYAQVPYQGFDWGGRYEAAQTDAQKAYARMYQEKWGQPPPAPFPKNEEEAAQIDAYILRWGVDPRLTIGQGLSVFSLWFHVTDPFWMAVVHGMIVTCSFLFLIGFATRLTAPLTWFGSLCYIHRDPAALFGVDTMMNILLMYLAIGPSGAALSVDRWLRVSWAKRRGLPVPPLEPSVWATVAIRLIQVHTCIIYLAAGLSKLQGQSWWTGTAPWMTIANPEYAPMQYGWYVDILRNIVKTRWVYESFMTISALTTLAFEIGYPFVIWRPVLRRIWLCYAVLLHLGIGMFMGLRTFSILMVAFNMAFLQPETIWWALGQRKAQKPPEPEAPPEAEPVPAMAAASPAAIMRQDKLAAKPVASAHHRRRR
jgi:hypothetical protein